jgi:hypothetical protein
MRPSWKLIGAAGVAGVAATGVVVARRRRVEEDYDPVEVRSRLHERLAGVEGSADVPPSADDAPE